MLYFYCDAQGNVLEGPVREQRPGGAGGDTEVTVASLPADWRWDKATKLPVARQYNVRHLPAEFLQTRAGLDADVDYVLSRIPAGQQDKLRALMRKFSRFCDGQDPNGTDDDATVVYEEVLP